MTPLEGDSPEQLPTTLGTRRAYSGRIVSVDVDTIRMPHGGEVDLEMVRHPGAAAIVALVDPASADPSVLLLRQYRHAADGRIWEVPAGVLEPEEAPEDCARRELAEETGARAEHWEHLTTIHTTPGFTDERIHVFLATGIVPGEARPATDELMTVEARPISRVLEMIRDGEITDAKTIVALLFVAGYRLAR
ncbi:MAG TPA: NUDIX hydrolase [Gemmatimonadales bacterium]